MVIALHTLLELINRRKAKTLLLAESSLPESQYKAFRRLFLLEFGEKGLEGELQKLYIEDRDKAGHGREYTQHERGCHHE